jgi:transglutaminase-like putative cysteine protease
MKVMSAAVIVASEIFVCTSILSDTNRDHVTTTGRGDCHHLFSLLLALSAALNVKSYVEMRQGIDLQCIH